MPHSWSRWQGTVTGECPNHWGRMEAGRCAGAVKADVHRTVAVSAPPLSAGNVTRMHRGLGPGEGSNPGQASGPITWCGRAVGEQSIEQNAQQVDLDARALAVLKSRSTCDELVACSHVGCPNQRAALIILRGRPQTRTERGWMDGWRPNPSKSRRPIIVYLEGLVTSIEWKGK